MEDEITTSEAARILDVLPRQVRWYYQNGLLAGRMIAGRLVFLRTAVETFVKPKRTGRPSSMPATKPTPTAKGRKRKPKE